MKRQVESKMRFIIMFVATVCFMFLVKRSSGGKVHQQSTMGKILWEIYQRRNFGYDVSICLSLQTVRVEVGRQDSLWGRDCYGNFPWLACVACRIILNIHE